MRSLVIDWESAFLEKFVQTDGKWNVDESMREHTFPEVAMHLCS